MTPTIEVWTEINDVQVPVGTARFSMRRGQLSSTFVYQPAYVALDGAYAIQPDMPLRLTTYHTRGLPCALRDSAPDRWGRHIVLREHQALAARDGVAPRALDDVDYLLGVSDASRQGSLRFRTPGDSRYLSVAGTVPPVVQLPRLLSASRAAERDAASLAALKELLDAGSGSLGGARPKASVLADGELYLAKFPHHGDDWDVMAWEKTALDLAACAGISVPTRRLVRIGDANCLLVRRFDREGGLVRGRRLAYLSGMSVTGTSDGEQGDYAVLGEAMESLTSKVSAQLESLFQRVLFSIAIHNVDDHLRNCGFLRINGSWELSPLFDVNPEPSLARERATAIFGEVGSGEVQGARDLAAALGISAQKARQCASRICHAVSQWRPVARKNGCREREMQLFEPVFADRLDALGKTFGQ